MLDKLKIGSPNIRRSVDILLRVVLFVLCVITPIMVVYEFGYDIDSATKMVMHNAYRGMLNLEWFVITLLYLMGLRTRRPVIAHNILRMVIYVLVSVVMLLQLALVFGWLQSDWLLSSITSLPVVRGVLIVVSIAQISRSITGLLGRKTNPSLILASSFAFIIVVGALLLMLPKSTVEDISWINAFFVSTSAVCVTGLTPVDIHDTFTTTGQLIILILIQIGGLGIMTITSFFGLFFAGGRTFSGQMVVGDLLSTERLSSLLHTLARILVVTFSIEAIGAALLYWSVSSAGTMSDGDALYFGIFHSISSFCNAGFSPLKDNLASPMLASLNSVRYVISFLIICGGIGFPIFSNFLSILAHKFRNVLRAIYGIRPTIRPHLWSLNSYIVVRTTIYLIISSFALFLLFEWNASLAGMDIWEKFSQGFLMAISPRTAGFNGIDYSTMLPASVMLTIVLMWIGGAPQSTAGGIKVTTAYVAVKNILASTAQADRLEVNHRRVPASSVSRAFGVITLSLIIIGVSVVLISLFEPQVPLINLVYEVVSAISTVGLSLSTTPLLGDFSKIILILLMFAGRVGLIALLLIFVNNRAAPKPYSYPEENIMIN